MYICICMCTFRKYMYTFDTRMYSKKYFMLSRLMR